MKKIAITLLLLFSLAPCFSQSSRKASLYISGLYSEVLYDRILIRNSYSWGVGSQLYLNNTSVFKPTAELTAELVPITLDILIVDEDGKEIENIETIVNLFGGVSYHPIKRGYISFTGGLSLLNGNTHLGIKPSIGFYFSRTQKVTAKVSYLNIFDRMRSTKEDFGAISVSLGIRIF